jgi:PAS domain S-box-containing protein
MYVTALNKKNHAASRYRLIVPRSSLVTTMQDDPLPAPEVRFRAVADSAPPLIWVTDPAGRNTFVNRAFLEFIGISREESETYDWRTGVHPEDRDAYVGDFLAAIGEARPFSARLRARRHDGSWRWLESRGNPRVDETGRVIEFVGCSTDITEMIDTQRALQEADRRKDEFLAMLAHELRNPLASIMSGTRLLRRLPSSAIESEETRDMIERQVAQLARLVDDLLDVSRISAGRIALRCGVIDARIIVGRAIEMSRPLIDDHKHRLSISLPGEPVPVDGDAARLAQVISNLLNNSAKYTDPGGEIRLTAELAYDEARIRVCDNGIGIAAEDLPGIFELFNRVDRSQAYAEGGLGIGLTLARRLVEMHGGSLEASSKGPGLGSQFLVRLPLAIAPALQDPLPRDREAGAALHRRRILLIDDNESFATTMTSLLRLKGHEVRTVHDGATSLAAARDFRPDIVLLDIGLPGMRGYDIARELRKDAGLATTTIVAMTGYGREQDQRKAKAAGFDYHLTKPVDDEALSLLIEGAPPR